MKTIVFVIFAAILAAGCATTQLQQARVTQVNKVCDIHGLNCRFVATVMVPVKKDCDEKSADCKAQPAVEQPVAVQIAPPSMPMPYGVFWRWHSPQVYPCRAPGFRCY